jgi:hypothetical protein
MDERQPADVATQLARETGNILVAEATASLYLAAAENSAWAQFWREVLEPCSAAMSSMMKRRQCASWGVRGYDLLRCSRLPDAYGDLLRYDGRVERVVLGIAQHESKGVRPGRKLEQCFGLSCPEMQMRFVLRDRLLGIDGVVNVDQ